MVALRIIYWDRKKGKQEFGEVMINFSDFSVHHVGLLLVMSGDEIFSIRTDEREWSLLQ